MISGTYNINSGVLTVVCDAVVYTVNKDHDNYDLLLECFKQKNEQEFVDAYHKKSNVNDYIVSKICNNELIEFKNNKLFYNGEEVHHSYVNRIVENAKEGFDIQPMLNFFARLMKNPSYKSIEQLPDFLMHRNLPITEDGYFLAYKSVRSNFLSKASGDLKLTSGTTQNGHILNKVGETISCDRSEVDDDRDKHCSRGLHVGCLDYSGPNGWYHGNDDVILIVSVSPENVVCVPKDHNCTKLRVCEYHVQSTFKQPLSNTCDENTSKSFNPNNIISPELLKMGDIIKFEYKGKNRQAIVDMKNTNCVAVRLLPGDPSYVNGVEYRKFIKSFMNNVQLDSLYGSLSRTLYTK